MRNKNRSNKLSRKQFLKSAGIITGAAALSAIANKADVHAAVSDNSESQDVSEDIVYFETEDETISSVPTAEEVQNVGMPAVLTGSEKNNSVFKKISRTFKNIRYLLALVGSTDISSLSDDMTITGAINALDGRITSIVSSSTEFESGHQYNVGDIILVNGKAYKCIKRCFTSADKDPLFNIDAEGIFVSFYVKGSEEPVDATLYWAETDNDNTATIRKDLGYPSEATDTEGSTAFAKIDKLQNNFDGIVATTAPDGTKIWIDKSTGVMKYHNGTKWVDVKSVWG